MIGKLKGILAEVDNNIGLVGTTGGVFYRVFLTPNLLDKHKVNDKIELYTYLQVREDALVLFGFKTKGEYDFFKMLLSVSGVGPKTAYSVVSFASIDGILKAIKENNTDYLTQIPGLGRKTSVKIIVELSQKLNEEIKLEKMYFSEEDKNVIDALVALGFKSHEAKKVLGKLPKNIALEEKVRQALKLIK